MADPQLAYTPEGVDEASWQAACTAVRSYCGWHIAPVLTDVVVRVRTAGRVILLPSLKVELVSQISLRGSVLAADQWELMPEPVIWLGAWPSNIDSPDMRFEWLSSLDSTAFSVHHTDRPVVAEVTMTHGFDTCPADILGVLTEAAQYEAGSVYTQVGMVRTGRSALPGAAAVVEERAAILDRYRLPRLS